MNQARPIPLAQLAEVLDERTVIGDATAVGVGEVTHDSRRVVRGALFACLRGEHFDGHGFAEAAVEAGAAGILCERELAVRVPQIVVPDVRAVLGRISAEVFGRPGDALDVVAVTGTNGKTTVATMVAAIAEAAGRSAGVIGTLTGSLTTPEAPDLQRQLAALRDSGVRCVALEASSHALAQGRLDGLVADVAVFTNLGRDHLDFHASIEAYFEAKARLFTPDHAHRAVVNLDDAHGRRLVDAALVPTEGFSIADATEVETGLRSSSFRWRGRSVTLGVGGGFNVANAVAAATATTALGIDIDAVAVGLASMRTVPGRFEVLRLGTPYEVLVDFAHTPEALARLLGDVRAVASGGRVILVFGCGGDRDREKRPLMGAVASELADRVVITSDNPRGENPGAIIAAILDGIASPGNVVVEADRRQAIAAAMDEARSGDLVVIAGKGHETGQIVGVEVLDFDDRVVASEESRRLRSGGV